jgi:hypothetical protein
MTSRLAALLALTLFEPGRAAAEPPFGGTVFIADRIITAGTPTRYVSAGYTGQAPRLMFDRRLNAFATFDAYLFQASYSDGLQIEFQVNPEFGSVAAAQAVVAYYAPVIGRLPRALRAQVQTSWIHQGDEAFGGGNANLLIHTGSIAQGYIDDGILEEVLAHEATHTSLDGAHAASAGWLAAQSADAEFISAYARDNPTREDVAESLVPWLGLRCARSALHGTDAATIEATIPARLSYFDALALDLAPLDCDPARVHRGMSRGSAPLTPAGTAPRPRRGTAPPSPPCRPAAPPAPPRPSRRRSPARPG